MSNAAVTTLSPEQARTLFDHLLPSIVQSRALTRELIRHVPDSKLDFLPVAGGETLSDLMWYLASAYDVFLNALCDAKFPDLPAKPQPASVQAFLDWDDSRFEQTVEKAKALSDADLMRPLTFGPFTQPAVEFITAFLGNVASHTGQLMMGMALVAQASGELKASKAPSADGELSDAELAGVAGGNVTYVQDSGGGSGPNINVHGTYNSTAAWSGQPIQQQHNQGLGALFGPSNVYNQASTGFAVLPGLVINGVFAGMRLAQKIGAAAWFVAMMATKI